MADASSRALLFIEAPRGCEHVHQIFIHNRLFGRLRQTWAFTRAKKYDLEIASSHHVSGARLCGIVLIAK